MVVKTDNAMYVQAAWRLALENAKFNFIKRMRSIALLGMTEGTPLVSG